jgi:hypothetical protein
VCLLRASVSASKALRELIEIIWHISVQSSQAAGLQTQAGHAVTRLHPIGSSLVRAIGMGVDLTGQFEPSLRSDMALGASVSLLAPNIPVEVRQERLPLAIERNVSGSTPSGLQVITRAQYTVGAPTLPIGSVPRRSDCSASKGHWDIARFTSSVAP